MFMRRRRPLMRAAMVGGAAYYGGKRVQEGRYREDEQEARLEDLEGRQSDGQPGESTDDTIQQITKLGELHDQGVLTDAEFEVQKRKLLERM